MDVGEFEDPGGFQPAHCYLGDSTSISPLTLGLPPLTPASPPSPLPLPRQVTALDYAEELIVAYAYRALGNTEPTLIQVIGDDGRILIL